MNTTICAPTLTMAAYASNQHNQFETNFSPLSTAFSDPGEYQFSARLRQGSISSIPPLDLNHSRVGLFTTAAPSPALSASTLNTTIGGFTPSMEAYALNEQRSAHAMGSFPPSTSTCNSVVMMNSAETSGQFGERLVTPDVPQLAISTPSSVFNRQEAHNGHSSQITNFPGRQALSLNTAFGSGTSTYPLDNAFTASLPLYSPWHGHGQPAPDVSILPALQLAGSGISLPYGQDGTPLGGSGHDNYAGNYGKYGDLRSYTADNTYAPALPSYSAGIEQYPWYNSNNTYSAGHQGNNGVGGSADFGTQSTTRSHNLTSIDQVDTLNNAVAPSPTALVREALATVNSMASGPYSEQEPGGHFGERG